GGIIIEIQHVAASAAVFDDRIGSFTGRLVDRDVYVVSTPAFNMIFSSQDHEIIIQRIAINRIVVIRSSHPFNGRAAVQIDGQITRVDDLSIYVGKIQVHRAAEVTEGEKVVSFVVVLDDGIGAETCP